MTEFLISIFYFVFFCFIISKQNFFKDEHIPKYWIYSLFGLKVIISIVLTAIYTKYYTSRETADIYKYFDDSKIMFEALKHKPLDYIKMLFAIDNDNEYFDSNYYNSMLHWVRPYSSDLFSDSHIIIRFNAFVRLFSFGYFQVHNVFMNFISLIGLLLIYKALKQFLVDKERALFYILSFTPSLLFWGSGLLKEGIILFGLGILLYSINRPIHFKVILFIALSVVILLYTKFYLLVALFIPTLGFTIVRFTKLKPLYSYSIAFICFIALICVLPLINNDWSIVNQIVSKQQTFSRFITQVETNSGFIIPELSNISTIIRNIPNALLNTFIRPFPWECNSFFIFLCFTENLLVFLSLILSFIYYKKPTTNYLNLFFFSLFFVVIVYILIGLTTPVFGAIVRYKVPALPFVLIMFLTIIDINRIKLKMKFLNRIL